MAITTYSCKNKSGFSLISSDDSKVFFENTIQESEFFNILSFEYFYNGGGVGIADFDKNGLLDIYFTGNMVSNALYLNKGKFNFQDVSDRALVKASGIWSTGVTIVDINNDSWPDIYVSVSSINAMAEASNLLFVNQGLDKDGIPVFKELAHEYQIDCGSHSTHAAFFDYDKDGDLDLYVLNNVIDLRSPAMYRPKVLDGTSTNNDKFYKNNGDNTFTDVTIEAGITIEGYGLGLALSDFNHDGWSDIYIGNDYITNDILYINQKNGSFVNQIEQNVKNQSKFSMGVATADFNHDGWNEIFVLDMLPADNYRLKKLNKESNYTNLINNEHFSYGAQTVRNMFQLNNGNGTFSEIGLFAGVYATDWSWTPLVSDFDNDGFEDIYVTNGFPKDVTDLDFGNYRTSNSQAFKKKELLELIPSVKISNVMFRNRGNLQFERKTDDWGISIPSFSNGAVVADLNNDGQLDIITNNINDKPFIFNNRMDGDFVRITFDDSIIFSEAIGAKIYLYKDDVEYYKEYFPHKSYLSSSEPYVHFGLPDAHMIDSLLVIWSDDSYQILHSVKPNQVVKIVKKSDRQWNYESIETLALLTEEKSQIDAVCKEENDFYRQKTIPFEYQHSGPAMVAQKDENVSSILVTDPTRPVLTRMDISTGEINEINLGQFLENGISNLLSVDLDLDGLSDMIIVPNKNKEVPNENILVLRNQGEGNFEKVNVMPDGLSHLLCLKAADLDNDGDLDLFVGAYPEKGRYPEVGNSDVLVNQYKETGKIKFLKSSSFEYNGIVSDALWTDVDNDGWLDLLIVSHWDSPQLFKNRKGKLTNASSSYFHGSYSGFWNSIVGGDFDNNGFTDYMLGNIGENTPFQVNLGSVVMWYNDFDENGAIDPLIGFHYNSSKKLVPLDLRDEFLSQLNGKKKAFQDYESYAISDLEDLLTKNELDNSNQREVDFVQSVLLTNNGTSFQITPLPKECQMAPVFGMLATDIDGDQLLDLISIGNHSYNREFWGSSNSSNGVVLKNMDNGVFLSQSSGETNFFVAGDGRSIIEVVSDHKRTILASQHGDKIIPFSGRVTYDSLFTPTIGDRYANIYYKNGSIQKREFYFGNTYMTQDNNAFPIQFEFVDSISIRGNHKRTIIKK